MCEEFWYMIKYFINYANRDLRRFAVKTGMQDLADLGGIEINRTHQCVSHRPFRYSGRMIPVKGFALQKLNGLSISINSRSSIVLIHRGLCI
jgi:hypothetical protein